MAALDAAAGSRLQTDAGLVLLDDEALPPDAAEDGSTRRRGLRRQGYGVDASSGWVTWDSNKVLWLPPAYRPDSTALLPPEPGASTPSAIVLGCRSGRVVVLRFPTGLAPGLSGQIPTSLIAFWPIRMLKNSFWRVLQSLGGPSVARATWLVM